MLESFSTLISSVTLCAPHNSGYFLKTVSVIIANRKFEVPIFSDLPINAKLEIILKREDISISKYRLNKMALVGTQDREVGKTVRYVNVQARRRHVHGRLASGV